jgi:hypothetical protein
MASSNNTLVALWTSARRIPDAIRKKSFRIKRSLVDSRKRGNHRRPASGSGALFDAMSMGQLIRGYFVPLIVSLSIGFTAIANGLALPWSATIAVLMGLAVHMILQIRRL